MISVPVWQVRAGTIWGMKVEQAAKRLGVSVDEVIERIRRGEVHVDLRDYAHLKVYQGRKEQAVNRSA